MKKQADQFLKSVLISKLIINFVNLIWKFIGLNALPVRFIYQTNK